MLFADLRGSLQLIADRDPEEAQGLLDAVLARMMDAVHRYGGTVNQVMGDGIMALFGAPLAHEDHAVRACYAGLSMQELVYHYAQELRAARGLDVEIRVGLDSGQVVVRSIMNDLHTDYSAIGQTVHLAARMEQMASPGTVLVTRNTLRLARGYVTAEALGPLSVKGVADPVEVYKLTGAAPARSRLQVAAASGLSRFVGRDAEMAEMHRALAMAGTAQGQLVAVVGEAGVGKSRLIWEFVRSAASRGWLVLEAAAVPYGQQVAYLPIVDLLRRLAGIADADTPAAVMAKVDTLVAREEASRFRAPILALLDAPVEDSYWTALTPDQRRTLTHEAIRYLVVRRSQGRSLCIVIDDLQWVDSETQAVLDGLVASLPAVKVLLVVGHRPEYQHDWGARSYYRHLRVDPLPGSFADELFEHLAGSDPELIELRKHLVERTEGNPFFLEESVRNLVEARALVGSPGAYRPTGLTEMSPLPDSVQSVLAARIDRLDPEEKRLLQAAAVIGKDVPRVLLEAIAELPPPALSLSLRRLQAGEFLRESRLFPEIEYAFKHALTMEVARASLTHDRRRRLDRRIVGAIEELAGERLSEHLARLAHHARQGEVWDKAADYCHQAGAKALAGSAHRSAAAYFEQALDALARLPQERSVVERAIDARLNLRNALSPLGEYKRMLGALTEAEDMATTLGDERRRGLVAAFLANLFTLRGEFARAVEHGERAVQASATLNDIEVRVLANAILGLAYFGRGQYRKALEHERRCLATVPADRELERFGMTLPPAVYARTVAAWSLGELGEFDEGLALAEHGLRLAEAADHPHAWVFACLGQGWVQVRQGEFKAAVGVLEAARARCASADLPAVLLELAWPLASAYAALGRVADALALLDEAIARAVALRHRYGLWLRSGAMAEVLLRAGRPDEALGSAQVFVELARQVNARGSLGWALLLVGEVTLELNAAPLADAEASLAAAVDISRELEMAPLAARCVLAQAHARSRADDRAAAARLALKARDMFAHLGMVSWSVLASRPAQEEAGD